MNADEKPSVSAVRLSFPALVVAAVMPIVFGAGGAWAVAHNAEQNHETRLAKLEENQLPAAVEMQSIKDRLSHLEENAERVNAQLDRIEHAVRK